MANANDRDQGEEHVHDHDHAHGHDHAPKNFDRSFAIGIALNLGFVLVEWVDRWILIRTSWDIFI